MDSVDSTDLSKLFALLKPCSSCPFVEGAFFGLRPERVEEILDSQSLFYCHKTATVEDDDVEYEDDSTYTPCSKTRVCAGFLHYMAQQRVPNQALRIAERLHLIRLDALDIDARVFKTKETMMRYYRKQEEGTSINGNQDATEKEYEQQEREG